MWKETSKNIFKIQRLKKVKFYLSDKKRLWGTKIIIKHMFYYLLNIAAIIYFYINKSLVSSA